MSARYLYRIGADKWRVLSAQIRDVLELGGGPTGRLVVAWAEPIDRSASWPLTQMVALHITVPPGTPPDQDAARRMVRSVVLMDKAGVEIPQSEADKVLSALMDRAAPLLLAVLPGFAAVSLSPKLAAVLVAAYKAAKVAGVAPDLPTVAKLVAREVGMDAIKQTLNRWLPWIGGVWAVAIIVAQGLGAVDLATTLSTLGSTFHLGGALPGEVAVGLGTIISNGLWIYGFSRKILIPWLRVAWASGKTGINRYLPLIGGLWIVATTLSRVLGYEQVAAFLERFDISGGQVPPEVGTGLGTMAGGLALAYGLARKSIWPYMLTLFSKKPATT